MTINLSLITPRYVIQVTDRRLSRLDSNGRLNFYTDDLTKTIVLGTRDSFSSIAFNGIGMDQAKVRTDDWLVGVLSEIKPADKKLTTVLEHLRQSASEWIEEISLKTGIEVTKLRHSFVLSGWQHDSIPFNFLVSNYEDFKSKEFSESAWLEFRCTFSRPKVGKDLAFKLMARGDITGFPQTDSELLARLAQKPGAKTGDIVNILVRSLRHVAGVSSTVSNDCVSVVIEKGSHMAKCKFHSADGSNTIHAPHYVGPITISHVKITRG